MFEALRNWWNRVAELGSSTTSYNPDYQDSVADVSEWADSCPVSDWDIH